MRLFAAIALCSLCGCTRDVRDALRSDPASSLYDRERFACDVLPVLVRSCAFLACHGDPAHAFRVYAPGRLRLGDVAGRADRDAPLSAAELDADFASAVGMLRSGRAAAGGVPDAIDLQAAPLLQKPLRADFGGAEHHGVGIFPRPPAQRPDEDPAWVALVTWAAGAPAGPRTAACAQLLAGLEAAP